MKNLYMHIRFADGIGKDGFVAKEGTDIMIINIDGDTYEGRETLKKAGYKWDGGNWTWTVSPEAFIAGWRKMITTLNESFRVVKVSYTDKALEVIKQVK